MKNWIVLLVVGILALVLGLIALANPFAASVTATLFVGWSFVFLGGFQIFAAFGANAIAAKIAGVFIGILALLIGLHIVGEPLKGLVSLTLVSGILFLISGAFKVGFGLFNFQGSARMAMILSGAVSVILGLMVLSNFPQSAAVLLGVLLAVELLSNGISAIALSFAVRALENAPAAPEETA